MTISTHGLALTKQFEGLRLNAYRDCAGVLTIGYGHTGADVHAGQTITEGQAENLLLADMAQAVACVNDSVCVSLTQPQFDALVDFTFNVGVEAFLHSTLLTDLNKGDYAAAGAQFGLWVHAGGKVEPGLITRRKAEADMFRGGV